MTKGTIKKLIADKKFGFILGEDGVEYFFHETSLQGVGFDDLKEGQNVTFDPGQGAKGPAASNVAAA